MESFGKILVGGIIIACCLLAFVVFSVNPSYRGTFVQSVIDVYVQAAFMVFLITMAFASLLKWS